MIRKDILDADRPHYYSQFWIDVAAGKREIGGPRTATTEPEEDESDGHAFMDVAPQLAEAEIEEPEPARPAKPAKPKAEPKRPEPARAPSLTSLADLAKIDLMMKNSAEMSDDTVPDIEHAASAPVEDEAIVTDFDPDAVEFEDLPEAEAEPELEADEFGNFEGEDEWGEEDGGPRRGSKRNKPRDRRERRDY
jgi:pyruvate/2-oxoglutarate dehydrogenase complex dihydrolipoamide acyltransferase (E2) component